MAISNDETTFHKYIYDNKSTLKLFPKSIINTNENVSPRIRLTKTDRVHMQSPLSTRSLTP